MTDPRSSILADEHVRRALLSALDRIDTTLGREEVGDLRDIVRVLVDPYHPESKRFIYRLLDKHPDIDEPEDPESLAAEAFAERAWSGNG